MSAASGRCPKVILRSEANEESLCLLSGQRDSFDLAQDRLFAEFILS